MEIFRLFLDKLHQPYNKTKEYHTDQNITVNITNLQDNGEENLIDHVEEGDGVVSSTNVVSPHLEIETCCQVELWLATGKIYPNSVKNLERTVHRFP
jgi:hypothetical protein